jgi:hypothetical protein
MNSALIDNFGLNKIAKTIGLPFIWESDFLHKKGNPTTTTTTTTTGLSGVEIEIINEITNAHRLPHPERE